MEISIAEAHPGRIRPLHEIQWPLSQRIFSSSASGFSTHPASEAGMKLLIPRLLGEQVLCDNIEIILKHMGVSKNRGNHPC